MHIFPLGNYKSQLLKLSETENIHLHEINDLPMFYNIYSQIQLVIALIIVRLIYLRIVTCKFVKTSNQKCDSRLF